VLGRSVSSQRPSSGHVTSRSCSPPPHDSEHCRDTRRREGKPAAQQQGRHAPRVAALRKSAAKLPQKYTPRQKTCSPGRVLASQLPLLSAGGFPLGAPNWLGGSQRWGGPADPPPASAEPRSGGPSEAPAWLPAAQPPGHALARLLSACSGQANTERRPNVLPGRGER